MSIDAISHQGSQQLEQTEALPAFPTSSLEAALYITQDYKSDKTSSSVQAEAISHIQTAIQDLNTYENKLLNGRPEKDLPPNERKLVEDSKGMLSRFNHMLTTLNVGHQIGDENIQGLVSHELQFSHDAGN